MWVVADKLSDDSLVRIASQFQSNRLPVVTWRHKDNEAVLLRAASFVVPTPVHRKKPSVHLCKNSSSGKVMEMGIQSSDVEALITTIVNTCPIVGEEFGLSGSFTQDMSLPPSSLMFAPDDNHPQTTPQSSINSVDGGNVNRRESQQSIDSLDENSSAAARYRHSLYESVDGACDWESDSPQLPPSHLPPSSQEYSRNLSLEEQPMTLSSAQVQHGDWEGQPPSLVTVTSLVQNSLIFANEERSMSSSNSPKIQRKFSISNRRRAIRDVGEVFGRGISKKSKQDNSQVNIASLPTAPRDWVVMDALKKELQDWQPNGLYIIGEKRILGSVPSDLYSGCTLLPVEVCVSLSIITTLYIMKVHAQ